MGDAVKKSNTSAKRQVAVKSWISDLVNGKYIRVAGEWEPNYIITPRNTNISRANIVGVVVSELAVDPGNFSFTLDDGTSKMAVRSFDENAPKDINLGDTILIIGRPREFGSEIYLMPEIIKKITNSKWLEHRKLELELLYRDNPIIGMSEDIATATESPEIVPKVEEELIQDSTVTSRLAENAIKINSGKTVLNPIDAMLGIIKGLDTDNGADIEDAITKSALEREKAEAIINNLMMDGEILEIKPGKLKVM